MKLFKLLLVAMLALAMLVGCGGDKNEEEAVLVIYSPNSDTEVENIIPAFEEKTGITVQLISAGTGECTTRLDAEKANPQCDIMFGGVNLGVVTQYPDIFQEYNSPNEKLIDENYQNETGLYSNYMLSGSGMLILNNELVEKLGLTGQINGYEDLLNPALKGKIAAGNPAKSSSAWAELTNMLLVMGDEPYDEKAWGYVEKFIEQLDGIQLDSSSAIYKGVVAGEYAVGVSYEDPCIAQLASGADVTCVYPEEGTVWLPTGTAIVANCPHPNNAKAFIDFLLSDECQQIISKLTIRGTNSKIVPSNPFMKPMSEINVVYEDLEYTAANKSAWQERYTNLKADIDSRK
ncbi:MAG: extracellular solute-binding protein [Erysipelotrichaceae bacterium]|nr:extracellular solute-binding protein [Erysipelotrichaceae bacterium]